MKETTTAGLVDAVDAVRIAGGISQHVYKPNGSKFCLNGSKFCLNGSKFYLIPPTLASAILSENQWQNIVLK